MDYFSKIDPIWKLTKACIFRLVCRSDYALYLRQKAKIVRLAARLNLYEGEHLAAMKSFLKPGDGALDIGAHYGVYAERMAHLVGATGQVTAFEPLPEVFEALKQRMNNFSQVRCLNAAITDGTITTLNLSVPLLPGGLPEPALASPNPTGPIYRSYAVPCQQVDGLSFERPLSFIKVDVEGAEHRVIDGARTTITAHRPVIQMEISAANFKAANADKPFGLDGYSLGWLEAGEVRPTARIEAEGIYYLLPH